MLKIYKKNCIVRGRPNLFDGVKIFRIAAIPVQQEILKTLPKSYPSYFHTYPRNGKTTVVETHSWVDSSNKTSLISELVVI